MMKIRHISLGALVALLMIAGPAQAVENPLYFGLKAGLMDPKEGGHDNALNFGGIFGFQVFDTPQGTGSVEAEATITVVDGEMDGGGDWDIGILAGYFAFRTAHDVYFKGKAGFANQNVGGTGSIEDDSVFSAGIGFGWHATRKAGVEFEYTLFEDVKFISLGFFSHF